MLYAESQYGEYLYGNSAVDIGAKDDTNEEGTYYTDLTHYVPNFILNMEEFEESLQAAGYEVGQLQNFSEDLENQLYISTATWGIQKWEKIYGISGGKDLPTEKRRAAVFTRVHGAKTFTPLLAESVAKNYTGVDTSVLEDTANYTFTVFFIGCYGMPSGIREFREWLERMKPAHLKALIKYRYVTWKELQKYKWKDLRKYTWGSVRVWQQGMTVTWHGLRNAGYTWKSIRRKATWGAIKNIEEAKE